MKVFFINAFIPHELRGCPLMLAVYPQYVLLQAKTKKGALAEALRVQQEKDEQAIRLIERLKKAGLDYSGALEFAPSYAAWVYCADSSDPDIFWHIN